MADTSTSSEPVLSSLQHLPKDKIVLEFIVRNLSVNGSPEKSELISLIFDMYRTSAGFNPLAVSKGRFKRLKAADFKQMVLDIDHELSVLIQTDEYIQLQAKQINHASLFDSYVKLSEEVNMHPASSMQQDVEQFEEKLHHHESQELLLSFYRYHHKFFEETYSHQQLDHLLEKFDKINERARYHARKIRCGFILSWLEEQYLKGKVEHKKIQEVWDELGILLTGEKNKFTRHELLISIIRCGLLTATPARNLREYLIYCNKNLDSIFHFNQDAAIIIYTALAHYYPDAEFEKRNEWLLKAEQISKENGVDDVRGYFKMIRAMNEADLLNTDLVMRYLNEAEHLVHRAQGRSFVAKNTWIQICKFKVMMYVLLHIKSPEDYPISEIDIYIRLAEDLGKHRYDIAILTQELNGLKNFVSKDWQSALECFEKAYGYRKNEPENDHLYFNEYFSALIRKGKNKNDVLKDCLDKLKEIGSPFFKSQAVKLCEEAEIYFNNHQKFKVKAIA